jgi:hypothetical protein
MIKVAFKSCTIDFGTSFDKKKKQRSLGPFFAKKKRQKKREKEKYFVLRNH